MPMSTKSLAAATIAFAAFGLEHGVVAIGHGGEFKLVNFDRTAGEFHHLAIAGKVIGALAFEDRAALVTEAALLTRRAARTGDHEGQGQRAEAEAARRLPPMTFEDPSGELQPP